MRRPLAVGAAVVLLLTATGSGGPAAAAAAGSGRATVTVSTATARVVVQAGNQPATVGGAAMTLVSLLGPQFAVVTNLGTAQPSKVVYTTAGLTVLPTVTVCTQPWTVPVLGSPSCVDGGRLLPLNVVSDATLVPPTSGTWFLMISGVASVGTLQATATPPVGTVTSS